jgi:hypothetical protein
VVIYSMKSCDIGEGIHHHHPHVGADSYIERLLIVPNRLIIA